MSKKQPIPYKEIHRLEDKYGSLTKVPDKELDILYESQKRYHSKVRDKRLMELIQEGYSKATITKRTGTSLHHLNTLIIVKDLRIRQQFAGYAYDLKGNRVYYATKASCSRFHLINKVTRHLIWHDLPIGSFYIYRYDVYKKTSGFKYLDMPIGAKAH